MDTKAAKLQIDHAKNQMRTEIARAKAELETASPVVFNSGGPGSRISVSRVLPDANKKKSQSGDVKLPRLGLKFSPLSENNVQDKESEFSDMTVLSTPGSHALKTEHIRKLETQFQSNLVHGERPTKSLLRVFHGHLGPVTSVDILQIDGKEYLFCGSVDRTCRMYDSDTAHCLRVFEGHVGIVTSVFAAKIRGSFREIKVSRMLQYKAEPLWDDEETDILEFQLNSVSKKVEFHVMYRDRASDFELAKLEINLRGDIFQDFKKPAARALRVKLAHTHATQTNPKGLLSRLPHLHRGSKRVALHVDARWQPASHSGTSGTLAFLLKQAAGLPVIRGATLAWVSVRVVESADALPHLLSGSADRTVAIWDVWTGARVQSLHGHTAEVTQVLLAERYGRQLVVSGSRDQSVRVWDIDSGACLHRVKTPSPVLAVAYYLSELEGTRTVDPASVLGPCRVNMKLTHEYDSISSRHTVCATVLRAEGMPSGGRLEGGLDTGTYVVAELGEESERSQAAPASPNPAWNLVAVFGPIDLTAPLLLKIFRVAASGEDQWVGHINVELKSLAQRRSAEGWYDVNFDPRSHLLLAAGCADCRVRILNAESGAEAMVMHSHQGAVTGMQTCVFDSATYLVTCAADGSTLLWSLACLAGPARLRAGLHVRVERRPLRVVWAADSPTSCVAAVEVFGALRVVVGCHDATAWMWTIEAKAVMNQQTWRARLIQFLDSIPCCAGILLCILADIISVLVFQFAVAPDDEDCFARESIAATAITCAVLLVFTVELSAQLIAHGRRYFVPVRPANYLDMSLIILSVAVQVFQVTFEYSLPVYDERGNFLPPVVKRADHPELCANATLTSDSARTTQQTFTAVRALRLIARVGIAFRVLRAVVKIARLAQLLGGGRGKLFDGHERLISAVAFAPPLPDPRLLARHAVGRGGCICGGGEEEEAQGDAVSVPIWGKWRAVTASADSTVHMYDIVSTDIGARRGLADPDQPSSRPSGGADLVLATSPIA